uniref:Uncharacterized protein n=1 Tax=Arundo donax TaxID=35708 RepID=A0A0A9HB90_ARUDO
MVEERSEGAAALQPMGSLVEGNGDATAPHPPSTSGSQPIWLNSLECKGGGHPDIGIVFQAPPPPLPSESCSQQQIRAVVELVEEDFRSNTVTMELGKLVEGKGVMESVLVEKDIRSKELSMDLSNSGLEASLLSPLNVGQGAHRRSNFFKVYMEESVNKLPSLALVVTLVQIPVHHVTTFA